MRLNIIAAVASNNAIGYKNRLLYHIKADMARFRQLTLNHTVIMGRRTFESLPGGALEGRRNIVLSNSVTALPGCEVYSSLDKALDSCNGETDVFVIGGESLYKESLPKAFTFSYHFCMLSYPLIHVALGLLKIILSECTMEYASSRSG